MLLFGIVMSIQLAPDIEGEPVQVPATLTTRIDGRRNSMNGSTASLNIRFWMRKRSNARTGIPTGGNAGEDEDPLGLPVA